MINTNLSPASTVTRNDSETVSTDFEDAVVLLHINNGQYYSLDEISAYIWEKLAVPITIDNLVVDICNRYDCTPEQCMADILQFLEQLSSRDLLIVS